MIAMAGGTNNNQLKAQLCPAHDGDKDNTPGMCLAVVVVVAAMTVWEVGSATAMVEKAATAAAEEADDGRGG